VNFAVVAKASPEKLRQFAKTKGWKFPFYSCMDSDFDRDFGVGFTPQEVAKKEKNYNFGHTPAYSTQNQGISVFTHEDGKIYHTYSTYARGIEFQNVVLTLLDLTPSGRYDDHTFDHFLRHKDEYQ